MTGFEGRCDAILFSQDPSFQPPEETARRPKAAPRAIVRAARPISQGRETCSDYRIVGMCPTPVQGSADITSLYTARYGAPPAGTKVYVRVNQLVDGWESIGRTFSAIVPTSP